jgi:small conductance mechanosensitive channel
MSLNDNPVKNVDLFYDKAYNWILAKGPGLVTGILILVIGLWLIKIFSQWLTRGLHKRDVDPSLKPFFIALCVMILRVLLVFSVLQIIGIEMTIFAALIGSFGVAAGLALSGTLQNFASGVLILLLKPFTVGDNIIAQGQEGTVSSIQIFYTIVTTFDNRTVVFPNSKLSNEVIVNISTQGTRRLDVEMKFNYGMDFNQIKGIMEQAIDESNSLLKSPARRIGVSALEDVGYKVMISVWTNAHGFNDTKFLFHEKLMADLKKANVKFPGMGADI